MKRLIAISLIILSGVTSVVIAKGPRKYIDVYDFSKGVDTYHSSLSLPEGFVQDSNNVFFDATAPVSKRQGFTVTWSTKSYSYTGLWTYTDATNTTWQIARSSGQITANNLAGSTVLVATVSVNNIVGQANAFGNSFFVDQSQGVYYWNGTSTTYVSGSPRGSIITQFHNRLWVSGLAVPNGNQLYGSKYYDGTTWTTGPLDTDPVQYSIGLNDNFDNLTAEYVYLDTLYLFKHYTIFALYGFGQSSFQISQLTQECGCIDGNTIQTFSGGLKFVSLRGVEDFDGYHCKRISDPVKNKIDPAIQLGGFAQNSWVQSSQSDFQTGTSSPTNNLSFTISPGDVIVSSFSSTDTIDPDFSSGTFNNTNVSNNSVILSTDGVNIVNNSFESSFDVGSFQNINRVSSVVGTCTISPKDGSSFADLNTSTLYICLNDISGNLVSQINVAFADNSCSWVLRDIPIPAGAVRKFNSIAFGNSGTGNCLSGTAFLTTNQHVFITNGSDIQFYTASTCVGSCATQTMAIDFFTNTPRSDITTGSFTSRVFDTGFSTSTSQLNADVTGNSFYFETQTSADGVTGWTKISASTSTNATSNRYERYVSSITIGSNFDALMSIDDVSILNRTSGTYYSSVHNTTNMNSWGNFSVDDILNGGNITYFVRSSTSPFTISSSTPSWISQTKNSQITASTGVYMQIAATFTITAATQTPTLNDFTLQWYTGKNPTPMSSTVWDNRYWLSLTTSTTDTVNDAVLVLSSRGSWSPLDIHAGAFTQTKGSLYHADSNATGNIYQDNQGYADNGVAINAFIQTKDYGFSDLPADDYINSIYPTADNTGNCDMTFQYSPDRSSTNYSLGTINLSEYASNSAVKLPFPIDSSHQDFGQTMSFTIGTNDATCAWNFYGIQGSYRERNLK